MADKDQVFVVSPDGKVGSVPRGNLAQAQRDGFTVANREQVAAARKAASLSQLDAKIAAGTLGFARGMTFGLSDAVAAKAYGDDKGYAEEASALKAANPTLTTGSELAGMVLGSKGAGAGRAGLATAAGRGEIAARALAPARGVAALGARTEQAVRATRYGKGMLPMVARGAVEGAGAGVGMTVSDSYLNDTELSAEKLAAGALQGGALGAGFAGTLGLAGAGVGKLFKGGSNIVGRALRKPGAGVQRMGDEAFGQAAPGFRGRVVDWFDAATSAATGAPRGAMRSMLTKDKAGRLGVEVAQSADDILAKGSDDLYSSLASMQRTANRAGDKFKGRMKANEIGAALNPADAPRHLMAARQTTGTLTQRLDAMIDAPVDYAGRDMLKKLRKRVARIDEKLDAASAAGKSDVGTRAYLELDNLKKDIGKHSKAWKNKRRQTTDVMATADALEDMYEKSLRPVLEDEGLWGRAGALQRNMNAPWSETIGTSKAYNRLFSRQEFGKWDKRYFVTDRQKVGQFVAGLKDPSKAEHLGMLERHLDSMQEFAKTAKDNVRMSAAERAGVEAMAAEAAKVRKVLKDSKDAIAASNQFKALQQASAQGSEVNAVLGGGIIGGAPGALVGGALNAVLNPAQIARRAAALHRILGSVDGQAGRALKRIARRTSRQVKLQGGRTAALQAEYEKQAATTRMAVENPGAFAKGATDTLAPLGAPQTAKAAASVYQRRQEYLHSQLPMLRAAGVLSPSGRPGEADRFRYQHAVEVIDDPSKILDMAASGQLTSAQVEAVAAVYPRWFASMQNDVITELGEMTAKGQTMPYPQRIAVGAMLQLPTDPLLEPDMIMMMQETYGGGEEPPPKGAPEARGKKGGEAPDIASAYRTGSESLQEAANG